MELLEPDLFGGLTKNITAEMISKDKKKDKYIDDTDAPVSKRHKVHKSLGSEYKLIKKIGSGAFGEVFVVKDRRDDQYYACKAQKVEESGGATLLFPEAKYLIRCAGDCIPRVKDYIQGTNYHILIMELLGPNLENLFKYCERKFSLKTILMIAIQTLMRINYLHSKLVIHKDIKPENFVVGYGSNEKRIYLVDFGLAGDFRSPRDGKHIELQKRKSLCGTARYASINTHEGHNQSRRDDLESLGYVLIYFLLGKLPWQGFDTKEKKDKYKKIEKSKKTANLEKLLEKYPQVFLKYLNYTKNLGFEDRPCTRDLIKLFQKEMHLREMENDGNFDWVLKRAKQVPGKRQ
ncbi:unnamed protein product [Moneuplotes crassus]|uniref:Casein kinase I n=1 Tax=Euplotes crassus TaxID=5936 RepID=A0AAD1UMH4_EUPCR|nr:unnamed protein product [Moneuplotes crassus]